MSAPDAPQAAGAEVSHPGGTMITGCPGPILSGTASPYRRWTMIAAADGYPLVDLLWTGS
jgi:hypothetical protein